MIEEYLTVTFGLYVGRWILSAVVMMPFLWLLIRLRCCLTWRLGEYVHLLIVQVIGAFIFYRADQLLFGFKG